MTGWVSILMVTGVIGAAFILWHLHLNETLKKNRKKMRLFEWMNQENQDGWMVLNQDYELIYANPAITTLEKATGLQLTLHKSILPFMTMLCLKDETSDTKSMADLFMQDALIKKVYQGMDQRTGPFHFSITTGFVEGYYVVSIKDSLKEFQLNFVQEGLTALGQLMYESLSLKQVLSAISEHTTRGLSLEASIPFRIKGGSFEGEVIGLNEELMGPYEQLVTQVLSPATLKSMSTSPMAGGTLLRDQKGLDPVFIGLNMKWYPLYTDADHWTYYLLVLSRGEPLMSQWLGPYHQVAKRLIMAWDHHTTLVESIQALSSKDQLTNLPNRTKFLKHLEETIVRFALSNQGVLTLYFLDFHGLKQINEAAGHYVGDQLLSLISSGFSSLCHDKLYVGRLAGDEFAFYGVSATKEEAKTTCQKILGIATKTYSIAHETYRLSANIGISFYGEQGFKGETLLEAARLAHHKAKLDGSGTYSMWG